MPKHCCPHCRMTMVRHSESGNQVSMAERGPCCELSSGKPAPALVPLPLENAHLRMVALPLTVPVRPDLSRPEKRTDSIRHFPEVSSQAVLCSFLI